MRKKYYFSLVVLGITIMSCTNENLGEPSGPKMVELSKNEVLSISYYDAKELSDNDIFDMVGSFVKNAGNDGVTKAAATSFKITKKTYINKEGEFKDEPKVSKSNHEYLTSTICEVEFNNGTNNGLAVVAADAKLPSVIAFIPNSGSDSTMELTGAKEMLHASKASYLYKAIKTRELVDSLRQSTLEKISDVLEIPMNEITYERIKDNILLTDASPSTKTTAVDRQPEGIQKLPSSIAPLVKTNWGQDDPYNGFFYQKERMDWVRTENGGKAWQAVPVGCVSVAIAQIMGCTHLRTPIQFYIPGSNTIYVPDFARMTAAPSIDKVSGSAYFNIQYLMLNLYEMFGTTSKKDWDGAVIASEVSDENMIRTMNNFFKFNSEAPFNGDQAWASLRNGNPVLMLTNDHAFVISGILITEMANMTRQLVKTNDVYWHANFGWANQTTGYYQLDSNANTYFEAGGTNEWCYKMKYVNNIRAK